MASNDMMIPLAGRDSPPPVVPFTHLDDLWFQVGGTLCDLEVLPAKERRRGKW